MRGLLTGLLLMLVLAATGRTLQPTSLGAGPLEDETGALTVDTARADSLVAPRELAAADTLVAAGPRAELGDSLRQVRDSMERRYNALVAPVDTTQFRPKAPEVAKHANFVPDPQRALWLALVLPGAGQIYNRKYWKIPIFYAGFLGCVYALSWNQTMYRDYQQAYLDIMDDAPNTKSYEDMLPAGYSIAGRESQFQTIFKKKKDRFRRYRDLSTFCFVGVYLLSVIDAYVDAQLSVFDISPDLSLQVHPDVIESETTGRSTHSYGLGCNLRF